jgi:hypothetical protein
VSVTDEPGFFVAPFGIDGRSLGIGFWGYSQLSDTWLGTCTAFIEDSRGNFDVSWPGNLSHIRTKLTSASGAALATFSICERIASSIVLLSGRSLEAEVNVTHMFVSSLRRVRLVVEAAAGHPEPFAVLLSVKERPLMAVVPWPEMTVPQSDHELVRELGLHLAGAFFRGGGENVSG